jgi:hypothetical protein
LSALNYNSFNHFAGEGQLCSDLRRVASSLERSWGEGAVLPSQVWALRLFDSRPAFVPVWLQASRED